MEPTFTVAEIREFLESGLMLSCGLNWLGKWKCSSDIEKNYALKQIIAKLDHPLVGLDAHVRQKFQENVEHLKRKMLQKEVDKKKEVS